MQNFRSPLLPTQPWDVTGGPNGCLRIGLRTVPLSDVRRTVPRAYEERDFQGSLLNFSVYLVIAAIFLILVVVGGWRERFLLMTVFLGLVGITSLIDMRHANPIRLYCLTIELVDGERIDFTSASADEVDRLSLALQMAAKTSE